MNCPGDTPPKDRDPAHPETASPLQAGDGNEIAMDALHFVLDKIWDNGWTERVVAMREEAAKARSSRDTRRLDETAERLSKLPITPMNTLVNKLDPMASHPATYGTQGYFKMESDEHWFGLIDLMLAKPGTYTQAHLNNVAYTSMVRLLAWHNMDESRDEQVSARSLLGSHKDQARVPLTMFGIDIPLLGGKPAPDGMLNPQAVALALAVDAELRVAGLLTKHGGRRQRTEAQIYLGLMPPSVPVPRLFNPFHREKPDSYWDKSLAKVTKGNPDNDLVALRLILDTVHPDYERYAMGWWEESPSRVKRAHKGHLLKRMGDPAMRAILGYGEVKARLGGSYSTFRSARAVAEANLRLLEGDAESTTYSGRRINEHRDRRLIRATRGSLPPAKELQRHVSETVAFCNQRYTNTWQPRARIERRRSRVDTIISLLEATNE